MDFLYVAHAIQTFYYGRYCKLSYFGVTWILIILWKRKLLLCDIFKCIFKYEQMSYIELSQTNNPFIHTHSFIHPFIHGYYIKIGWLYCRTLPMVRSSHFIQAFFHSFTQSITDTILYTISNHLPHQFGALFSIFSINGIVSHSIPLTHDCYIERIKSMNEE